MTITADGKASARACIGTVATTVTARGNAPVHPVPIPFVHDVQASSSPMARRMRATGTSMPGGSVSAKRSMTSKPAAV